MYSCPRNSYLLNAADIGVNTRKIVLDRALSIHHSLTFSQMLMCIMQHDITGASKT